MLYHGHCAGLAHEGPKSACSSELCATNRHTLSTGVYRPSSQTKWDGGHSSLFIIDHVIVIRYPVTIPWLGRDVAIAVGAEQPGAAYILRRKLQATLLTVRSDYANAM